MPNNTQELLPIVVQENTALIDARLLHHKLKSKSHFADWIKSRIQDYGFVDGSDYFSEKSEKLSAGRKAINYLLTLDMAKELAMLERNEVGRNIRRYFIQKEKELRGTSALPRQADLFKGLKAKNINGRRLFNYRSILEKAGYSLKTGGSRRHRYPQHFVLMGHELLITEEFALHLHHQRQVYNNRVVLQQMQPVLPFDFGDVKKLKGGTQ